MSDPTRWLKAGSDASTEERQWLDAARRDELPASQQDAIWQSLQARLPPPPGPDSPKL